LAIASVGLGDRLGGGADVQDQRAVVRHLRRHGAGDPRLAVGVKRLPEPVAQVLGGRTRHPHAAVKARQQARFGESLHVTAHRLQRHARQFGQLLDGGRAARAHGFEQMKLAWIGVDHGQERRARSVYSKENELHRAEFGAKIAS
jgi:hypothetical protein